MTIGHGSAWRAHERTAVKLKGEKMDKIKDKTTAQYSNGFSFLLSRDSGEAVIAFTQNQPEFSPEAGKFQDASGREVATIIMPYELAKQLCENMRAAIDNEEAKAISRS